MKILIAEDESNISRGVAAILCSEEKYKCQIKCAENGQEALEIAEKFRPDLVITDIRMFKMTGLQLAEKLKERNLCDKVIIISGYSKFEYAQKALRVNVLDYLVKPIDKQQLLDLVDSVWRELPTNYFFNKRKMTFQNDFFRLNLENDEYPENLKKAIRVIQKKYMEDISIQTISERLMLHPNYLSTLLNRHLKVNFAYLLDYVRLEAACEMLITEPDLTIAELSYIVGYSSERRLYQAFAKRLNCTPGDFRKIALDV